MEMDKKRVDPAIIQTSLLQDIARLLSKNNKFLQEGRPEGVVEPIEPIQVTNAQRYVKAPRKPWFSVIIVNDGPDDVYAKVNLPKSDEWHRVAVDETYTISMGWGIISDVMLQCDPGHTSSVRLVGTR